MAKVLLNFVGTNFLPIALVSGVALGIANPTLGCLAHRYSLSKLSTFGIFFISGLKLQGGEIEAVAEAWPAGIFGLVSILLLSPFFSRLILQVQLAPQEFVTGLAIFSCMPTTLSSGVALTQLVGGNSALALAMTVVSNLLGILVVPFWISKFLADGFGVSIPNWAVVLESCSNTSSPFSFGKASEVVRKYMIRIYDFEETEKDLRKQNGMLVDAVEKGMIFKDLSLQGFYVLFHPQVLRNSFQGLPTYVDKNHGVFSIASTILLSLTPWMQVSKSRPLLLMVKPVVFLEAIGMGIFVHLSLLIFNAIAVQSLSACFDGRNSVFAKKENSRALLLVSSQKALLIAVAVVEQLGGALGESGLLVLPCVAAHINQIIIDSFLVNFWLHKDQSHNNMKKS
ncbi:hypothetical protein L1049_014307 [Liquidambar formosana]|uniref:Sodium/metabolite cotransporter BASS4, chloroplastic n=1 Tax=Liquidambar formosana TaxID=63359 RepID=A0AAP0WV55_LIQFO